MPKTTIPPAKLAFSIDEGCAALGITRPTIYKLIHRGELRTKMVGTRRLIPAAELERLLADAS
jgi:excisionase family DNA binding protein